MAGTPTIYFQSLNRQFTICGVERSLFFLFVGLCLPIAFSARFMPIMDGIALLVFVLLYIVGVMITKTDYQMLNIYRRHVHYHKYYLAVAGIHAKVPLLKSSVPT